MTFDKSVFVFETILKSHNIDFKEATSQEDMEDHIDYHVVYKKHPFTVDIKGAKKFFENPYLDKLNEWIWVETQNVQGKAGWVFGKSDFIVFTFTDELWFIRRTKLVDLLKTKVIDEVVTDKGLAKYKKYRRKDRQDCIISVNLGDIKNIINPIIIKAKI